MRDGATVGVLMLATRFPRLPGDVGCDDTFAFPVLRRVVAGATADRVVRQNAAGLDDAFLEAARGLAADGAEVLTTSCGFLAGRQRALAEAAGAPVASSSLMQIPLIEATLPPGRRCGVLTIDAAHLSAAHLRAAGAPADAPVGAPKPDGAFVGAIMEDRPTIDAAASERELIAAARALAASAPLGALVLECANMAPHAAAIRRASGLPVHSIVGFVEWLRAAARPPVWPAA